MYQCLHAQKSFVLPGVRVWMGAPRILQEATKGWLCFFTGFLAASWSWEIQHAHFLVEQQTTAVRVAPLTTPWWPEDEGEDKNEDLSLMVKLARLPRHLECPYLVLRVKYTFLSPLQSISDDSTKQRALQKPHGDDKGSCQCRSRWEQGLQMWHNQTTAANDWLGLNENEPQLSEDWNL